MEQPIEKAPEPHSLIPLGDFKAILGIDDRENTLSRYCLITATYTIEQYCKRRLLRRKNTDYLSFTGEHIFTLREYPVEYRIAGITQIAVNEDLDLTFDTLLRRVFRQDPDIIMVGEIRDIETAELAVRAALTGHIVFATLHTTDAAEAVYRLQDMGIPAYMVVSVLKAVIAQRLVRRICPHCRLAGCPECSGTGYQGRMVISEIITLSRTLAENIAEGIKPEALRRILEENNYKSFYSDAKEKVAAGITTDEEIRRELGPGYE